MFDAKTHELLCLFSVMILADKRVFSVEIDGFVDSATLFFQETEMSPAPSQARLFMWFENNRDNIRTQLVEDNFEPWFEGLMHRVAKNFPAQNLIKVLHAIAKVDGEVHISETALVVLVDQYLQKVA